MATRAELIAEFKSYGYSDSRARQLADSQLAETSAPQEREEPLGFVGGFGRGVRETGASYTGGLSFLAGGGKTSVGRAFQRTADRLADEDDDPQLTTGGKVGRAIGRIGSEVAGTAGGIGLAARGATRLAPGIARALRAPSKLERAKAAAKVSLPVDVLQASAYQEGLVLPGVAGALAENVALGGALGSLRSSDSLKKSRLEAVKNRKKKRDYSMRLGAEDKGSDLVPTVRRFVPQQVEDAAIRQRGQRQKRTLDDETLREESKDIGFDSLVQRWQEGTLTRKTLTTAEYDRLQREHVYIADAYDDAVKQMKKYDEIAKDTSGKYTQAQIEEAKVLLSGIETMELPGLYNDFQTVAQILSKEASGAGLKLRQTQNLKQMMEAFGVKSDGTSRLLSRFEYETLVRQVVGLRSLDDLAVKHQSRLNKILAIENKGTRETQLSQFIAGLQEASWLDVIIDNRRAGLLSMPASWIRNLVGSTESAFTEFVEHPLARLLDARVAKGLGVEPAFGDRGSLDRARDYIEGFGKGYQDVKTNWRVWLSGKDPEDPLRALSRALDYGTVTDNPAAQAALKGLQTMNNTIYGLIAAGDKPFYEAAFNMSLKERALTRTLADSVVTNGTVKRGSKEFDDLFEKYYTLVDRSDAKTVNEDIVMAAFDALDATYKTKTRTAEALRSAQQKGSVFGRTAEILIPFPNTPTNIIRKALERIPILGGLAIKGSGVYGDSVRRHVKEFRRQGVNISTEAVERQINRLNSKLFAKQITGSAAALAGYMLHKNGSLTTAYTPPIGASPEERDEAQRRELTGEGAMSVRIGDTSYSLASLGTIAPLIAIGAAISSLEEEKDEELLGEHILGTTAASVGRTIGELPLLTGATDAIDALRGVGMAKAPVAGRQAATLLPMSGMLRAASYAVEDAGARQPDTFVEGLKSSLPGVSKDVAARVNTLGEIVPPVNAFNRTFNPLTPRSVIDGPLYEDMATVGYRPPMVRRRGETRGEFATRRQEEGGAEREVLQRILSNFTESTGLTLEQIARDPEQSQRLERALDRALTRTRSRATRRRRAAARRDEGA